MQYQMVVILKFQKLCVVPAGGIDILYMRSASKSLSSTIRAFRLYSFDLFVCAHKRSRTFVQEKKNILEFI